MSDRRKALDRARLEAREAWVEQVMRHTKARGALPVAVALAQRYVSRREFSRTGRLIAWPGVASLVAVTARHERTVQHQLSLLHEHGFLERIGQKARGNNIIALVTPQADGVQDIAHGAQYIAQSAQDIAPDTRRDTEKDSARVYRHGRSGDLPSVEKALIAEVRRSLRAGRLDFDVLVAEEEWRALAIVLEGEAKAGRITTSLAEFADEAEHHAQLTFGKGSRLYARIGKVCDQILEAAEEIHE